MLNLLIILSILVFSCSLPAAAKDAGHKGKKTAVTSKTAAPAGKQNIVIIPLVNIPANLTPLANALESALVEGLNQRYVVFSGPQVEEQAKKAFAHENTHAVGECDETRCIENIALFFQAELIGFISIKELQGDYYITFDIKNIFDNKAVYSKASTCEKCKPPQVLEALKQMTGGAGQPANAPIQAAPTQPASPVQSAQATQPAPVASAQHNYSAEPIKIALPAVPQAPSIKGIADNAEGQTWLEVVKSNTVADYQMYLDSFPNGKYAKQAKEQKQKLEAYAQAKAEADTAQEELNHWNEAQKTDTPESYDAYLNQHPKGAHAVLAKLKRKKAVEVAAVKAEAAAVQAELEHWNTAQKTDSVEAYDTYLQQHPAGIHVQEAKLKKDKADELLAAAFLKEHPAGSSFRDCPTCPEMVVIPAGSFEMGYTGSTHHVTISKAFAVSKYEVTEAEYEAMGGEMTHFSRCKDGGNCPIDSVSWNDAQGVIQKFSQKTGKQYRLLTEAEWEYACRAGQQTVYCGGNSADSVAWHEGNSRAIFFAAKSVHPVGKKQANAFGLYDMSGNVLEWTQDSWHDNYAGAPTDGSEWGGDGATRVVRGGSYNETLWYAIGRSHIKPTDKGDLLGFRVARTLP